MKKVEKKWTRVICFLLCMMLTCGTFTTGASAAEIKNSQQISNLNLTVGKLLSQKMFNITMGKGQAINLLNIKGMTRVKISYRSSNNKVVAVNSKGVIKGVNSGNAVVNVKVVKGGNIYKIEIKVKVNDNVEIENKYKEFLRQNKSKYKYYTTKTVKGYKYPVLLVTDHLYDPYNPSDPLKRGKMMTDECTVFVYSENKVKVVKAGKLTCRACECLKYENNTFYSVRVGYIDSYVIKNGKMVNIGEGPLHLYKDSSKYIKFKQNNF